MGQRSITPGDLAGRCTRCWMRTPHCICARIPRLESRARFVVLRHAKERWRSTNTARIAALALSATEVIDYGLEDQPPLDPSSLPSPAYLLFPGSSPTPPPKNSGPIDIIVPDGNWHQAGRLARRLRRRPGFTALTITTVDRAPHTLRRTKVKTQLSTIEAMAATLDWMGEADQAVTLRQIYRHMVEASIAGRGGRNRELLGDELATD